MVKPEEDDKQSLIALSDLGGVRAIQHTESQRNFMRLVDIGWATREEIDRGMVYSLTDEGKRQVGIIKGRRKLR